MNILFIIITPGDTNTYALVPASEAPGDYVLNNIDNKIVNVDEFSYEEVIIDLYKRFGLEPSSIKADLAKYLRPEPPFKVDKVIVIGWAI